MRIIDDVSDELQIQQQRKRAFQTANLIIELIVV